MHLIAVTKDLSYHPQTEPKQRCCPGEQRAESTEMECGALLPMSPLRETLAPAPRAQSHGKKARVTHGGADVPSPVWLMPLPPGSGNRLPRDEGCKHRVQNQNELLLRSTQMSWYRRVSQQARGREETSQEQHRAPRGFPQRAGTASW